MRSQGRGAGVALPLTPPVTAASALVVADAGVTVGVAPAPMCDRDTRRRMLAIVHKKERGSLAQRSKLQHRLSQRRAPAGRSHGFGRPSAGLCDVLLPPDRSHGLAGRAAQGTRARGRVCGCGLGRRRAVGRRRALAARVALRHQPTRLLGCSACQCRAQQGICGPLRAPAILRARPGPLQSLSAR